METREIVLYEELTGLPFSEFFYRDAPEIIKNKLKKPVMMSLDISNFKLFNEMYGFDMGDQLIKRCVEWFCKKNSDCIIAHNLKASKEQIIDDLNGFLSPLQRRMMKELLNHLDELNTHIRNLDDEIDNFMKPEEKKAASAIQNIPGIADSSAKSIISVIGYDMKRFPTARHLASWAGISPGNNESAHNRKSGKTTKGNTLLRETLVICAHSAARVKTSYFHAQFQRLRLRRGAKKAYVAVAHSMLIAIYHILNEGVAFKDLGAEYYNKFNKERKINSYLKKLKELGYEMPAVVA